MTLEGEELAQHRNSMKKGLLMLKISEKVDNVASA
jgi:hypothetical protein